MSNIVPLTVTCSPPHSNSLPGWERGNPEFPAWEERKKRVSLKRRAGVVVGFAVEVVFGA